MTTSESRRLSQTAIAALSSSPLATLLALLLLWFIVSTVLGFLRLRHIPGPRLWAWTRWPLIQVHLDGTSYEKYGELVRQYGKLVRIGPNYLLTSDPDFVRHMNSSRSGYVRANWYVASRLTPGRDNMISDRNEQHHEVMRKKAAPAYSGKENTQLERDVDECVLDFVRLVRDRYITTKPDEPKPMEFARKVSFFTSDTISLLAFNEKFNDLKDDTDHYCYLEEVETLFPNMFCTSMMPELLEFLTWTGLLSLFDPANNPKLAFGKVMRIAKKQINARLDEEGNLKPTHGDMMGSFIKHGMSKQELEQETILQIFAGSDTTATGIRTAMLGLLQNREAYKKLTDEIDEAVRTGNTPGGPEDVIKESQAKKLPYLQAVIKEGLRMTPPTGGLLAKETPPEGDTIEGHFVPGGVIVGFSQQAVHHDPILYGPDPDIFRPERWLPYVPKSAIERNNDLIFGHGKYSCLGRTVAFLELNKIFVELLRRYHFELVNPEKPWDKNVCYGIHLQRGLWVNITKREGVEV